MTKCMYPSIDREKGTKFHYNLDTKISCSLMTSFAK